MDAVQWSQGIGFVKQTEESAAQSSCTNRQLLEKKPRPQEQINCPRCNSSNTKFCYYNNYSLTQPRYFCKSCRRYWTEGGTLRNVPVGGGSRKNRRPSQSSASPKVPDLNPPSLYQFSSQNPKIHEGQDLNLGFPASQDHYGTHGSSHTLHVPKCESGDNHEKYNYYHPFSVPNKSGLANNGQYSLPNCSSSISSTLELLRTGNASREFNNFLATPMSADTNTMYSSGVPSQESKPNLTFSINGGVEPRYWNLNELQGNGGRLLFPIVEQKDHPSTTEMEENKVQGNSAQCWDGTFNGRSW